MIDKDKVRDIQRRAEEAFAAGEPAKAEAILKEGMASAKAEGFSITASELEQVAAFVQKSVDTALQEIIETSKKIGTRVVPVELLEALVGRQCTGARMLWDTVDRLDVPVEYDTVPDDLSGLEGL